MRKQSVTDRQTDGQTQINNPPFLFEKAGDNKKEGQKVMVKVIQRQR